MTTDQIIALLTAVSAMVTAFFGNKINQGAKENTKKLETLMSEEALVIDQKLSAVSLAHVRAHKDLRAEIEKVSLDLEALARSSKDNREALEGIKKHLSEEIAKQIHHEFEPIRSQTEWINDFMVKVKASKVVNK